MAGLHNHFKGGTSWRTWIWPMSTDAWNRVTAAEDKVKLHDMYYDMWSFCHRLPPQIYDSGHWFLLKQSLCSSFRTLHYLWARSPRKQATSHHVPQFFFLLEKQPFFSIIYTNPQTRAVLRPVSDPRGLCLLDSWLFILTDAHWALPFFYYLMYLF